MSGLFARILCLSCLPVLIALVSCAKSSTYGGIPRRPAHLPRTAKWAAEIKKWVNQQRVGPVEVQEVFNERGQRISRALSAGTRSRNITYYPTGKVSGVDHQGNGPKWISQGRVYMFESDGRLGLVGCSTIVPEDVPVPSDRAAKCGKTVEFDASGKFQVTHEELACELGCGEFRPLLEPGEYRLVCSSLRVRAQPDEKSRLLFTVAQDQKIQVTKDTHKIVTIGEETAPWVRIRTADGKEGYVFGGYIRGKDEPYVNLSQYK